jgi:gluconate 2-dehydrogenase gamma chain
MRPDKQERARFKVLTQEESETLECIAERIFPATDTPGAVEIGAVCYIDTALAGDYAALVPLYRKGLRAVNRHSRATFGRDFRALSSESQVAVLLVFESGSVSGYKAAAEFFETVRYHVMEGVFCEPHYGGNKEMMGWRLVGFPGQQFGYADPYINKSVDLAPIAATLDDSEKKQP